MNLFRPIALVSEALGCVVIAVEFLIEAQGDRFFMDRADFFRLKLTSCVAKYDDGGHVGDIFHLIRSFGADAGKMHPLGSWKK